MASVLGHENVGWEKYLLQGTESANKIVCEPLMLTYTSTYM